MKQGVLGASVRIQKRVLVAGRIGRILGVVLRFAGGILLRNNMW